MKKPAFEQRYGETPYRCQALFCLFAQILDGLFGKPFKHSMFKVYLFAFLLLATFACKENPK
ncbi:MAG: hypothetical protein D6767_09290, partial [Candidatus Hydrogenedentota bacterium]